MEGPLPADWEEHRRYPSDYYPRLGGSRPTKALDPELAAEWLPGTCYFCRKNVSKGKDGYSIVPSLQAKVYAHRVCSTKVRKDRLALVVAEQRAARVAAMEEAGQADTSHHGRRPPPARDPPVPVGSHDSPSQASGKPLKIKLMADIQKPHHPSPAASGGRRPDFAVLQPPVEAHSESLTSGQSPMVPRVYHVQDRNLTAAGKRQWEDTVQPGGSGLPEDIETDRSHMNTKRRRRKPNRNWIQASELSSAGALQKGPCESGPPGEQPVTSIKGRAAPHEGRVPSARDGQGVVSSSGQGEGLTPEAEVAASLEDLSGLASLALEHERGEMEPIVRRTRGSTVEAEVAASLQKLGSSVDLKSEDTQDSDMDRDENVEPIVRRTRISSRINLVAEELAVSLQELKSLTSVPGHRPQRVSDEDVSVPACTSSPGHSGDSQHAMTHRVRSKRRPDKSKWGSIADILKQDGAQAQRLAGKQGVAPLPPRKASDQHSVDRRTAPLSSKSSIRAPRSSKAVSAAQVAPSSKSAGKPPPGPPARLVLKRSSSALRDRSASDTDGDTRTSSRPASKKPLGGPQVGRKMPLPAAGSAGKKPSGKVSAALALKPDPSVPELLKLSPRLVAAREAATMANTRMLSSKKPALQAVATPKASSAPRKVKEEVPIISSHSSVPDWHLNINQCRARLKSMRERTEQAENDLKERSRLLQAAEKRVKALQQQVDRLSNEADNVKAGGASSSRPTDKMKEIPELALEAQENLEKAGFPRLLRKFMRGTSEGNITPSRNSLWWNLVNDTSTNLLRPRSNKFEFSLQTKEWLFSVFHAPTGRAAYSLLRGEGGVGSNTWDVDGAQYNVPLPSTRTLHQFAKENPEYAAEVAAAASGPLADL